MRWVLVGFATVNFAVFAQAIRSFFARPSGMPGRMVALSIAGTAGALVHIGSLALMPPVAAGWQIVALAGYATSFALFTWARRTVRQEPLPIAFSGPASSGLVVTTGPFALMRHPFYTAYGLTWLAGVAGSWSMAAAIVASGLLLTYRRVARLEEAELAASDFGDAYRTYAAGRCLARRLWRQALPGRSNGHG
jgi:protein-S-isoprenylcysteine O-methyltransferase Ste14